MKDWLKKFSFGAAALLALLLLASPALARTSWFFTVENENGEVISSNVTATVFTANAQTTVAVYDDNTTSTVKDNPLSPDTDGIFRFWTDATSDVDLVVYITDADEGAIAVRRVFSATDHKVKVDQGQTFKHLAIRYVTGSQAETDTGVDIPSQAIVTLAYVEELEGITSATLDVGTLSSESGGDPNGFCAGTDIATAGITRCSGTLLTTAGVPHIMVAATQSVTYTVTSTGGSDGYFHILYYELRNR